jgi:hypothetical protein
MGQHGAARARHVEAAPAMAPVVGPEPRAARAHLLEQRDRVDVAEPRDEEVRDVAPRFLEPRFVVEDRVVEIEEQRLDRCSVPVQHGAQCSGSVAA